MNLLRKLLGVANSAGAKDYDYYVIQKRQGGIYGRWETIEDQLPDFMDSATGFATYSDGNDTTLRCLGVKKFGDREIKKQLWVHFSREDTEEEIEERKSRAGKKNKDKDEDSLDKYLRIMREAKAEEKGKSEKELEIEKLRSERELGMIQDFYEKYFALYTTLGSQNGEANKYTVWQQGIHEISEVGKEIVKELRGGGDDEGEDNKKDETASFEEYKIKALPPASQEGPKNNRTDKSKPGAALLLMAKYIEANGSPASYLETIAISFPKSYTALASMKNPEELLEKLKPFETRLPALGTEEARVWLAGMIELILNQDTSEPAEKPVENDNPVPEKTGAEVESDIKGD